MAVGGAARHQLTGLVGGLQFPALVSLTVRWLGRFPSPAPSMARVRRRGPWRGRVQQRHVSYRCSDMTTAPLMSAIGFLSPC